MNFTLRAEELLVNHSTFDFHISIMNKCGINNIPTWRLLNSL